MTVAPETPTTPEAVTEALKQRLGEGILKQETFRDEHFTTVSTSALIGTLAFLKDEQGFDHLSDVTAVDYLGQSPRFEVVYHLFSFSTHVWYRIKLRVDDGQPVPTVTNLWPCANWAEREVWDLFGIPFSGHPNLFRIMMPEGWVGHPLRKDYPMSQITLPRSGATKIPDQRS